MTSFSSAAGAKLQSYQVAESWKIAVDISGYSTYFFARTQVTVDSCYTQTWVYKALPGTYGLPSH